MKEIECFYHLERKKKSNPMIFIHKILNDLDGVGDVNFSYAAFLLKSRELNAKMY